VIIPIEGTYIFWDEKDKKNPYASQQQTCKDMIKDIERHVDGIEDIYQTHDMRYECSYCGYEWEEDENGCPVCCQKAIDDWEKGESDE